METDSSPLTSTCTPDFFNSLQVPFNPPAPPTSREEALFFLSTGGRNCLGDLLALLDEYLMDLKASDGFPKSQYFKGFSKLGVWLSKTCTQIFTQPIPGNLQMERCTDAQWMERFAHDAVAQQDFDTVVLLRKSLWEIVDYTNKQWNTKAYWKLVIKRLRTEADLNEKKYADNLVLRDRNNRADRQELYESLKNDGLFDVLFERYFSEDESEFVVDKQCKGEIAWLQKFLQSPNPMTIKEVYAAIVKDVWPNWNNNQIDEHDVEDKKIEVKAAVVPTSGEQHNLTKSQTLATQKKKNNPNVLLLKFALRYRSKGCSPTAKQICNESLDIKNCPKAIFDALKNMKPHTITRAKRAMEAEGYQFDSTYQLKEESYDRLVSEVDSRKDEYVEAIENKMQKQAK